MKTATATRRVTCRYLSRRTANQCTAEAVDPNGDILLCTHHLALALSLLRYATATREAATRGQ